MTAPSEPSPIRTLLVANRGEIARRIIRTARAMGITTVAIYADPDEKSPHVAEADRAVRLPGASPAETYLRSALVVDAAARTGADAIHPGYGFLSESGDFARVVVGAGLTWIGPPAVAIDVMGSKIAAKELVGQAGVPTLPSVVLDAEELPEDDELEAIGWPLLVKASAGGGGRGMRLVGGPVNLPQAVAGARREALAAFGDGALFLERYLADPRHIEVQVLADASGDTVALFERECSIQRRHQKIIEEAPSPFVTGELRERLVEAALRAARAVGYVNAGTVEFVVDAEANPYFLEMNTRLQVEHPVTEAVCGLDLVRLQILIAGGAPLPDAVHAAVAAGPQGHAIEARLYAEDPVHQWRPSAGRLHTFEIGPGPGSPAGDGATVRVDSGFESGNLVGSHFDPLLAKVIVHAASRAEATSCLASTLARARIHGVTTNRDLLVRTLRHQEFESGDTDTGFLERVGLAALAAPLADRSTTERHAVTAALCAQAARRASAVSQRTIPSGFRNNRWALEEVAYETGGTTLTVGYRFDRSGKALAEVTLDGTAIAIDDEVEVTPEAVTVTIDGVRTISLVHQEGPTVYVDCAAGSSVLTEVPRFAEAGRTTPSGSALAPMPGGVVRVAVSPGDTVGAGQVLVVLEAMKMEHAVNAPASGVVADVVVTVGDQVSTGAVLVVVDTGDGTGEGGPDTADGITGSGESAGSGGA
ncbi:MAG: acetyl/propionyl/methylcrotonyl-CoA carboxylase subunit alpha [Acidimicrobiales bacterium]